ncbi:hypothetical protein NEOC95_002358 [Neochlamydia sp. AcF95]|nr:hypothetical protein [Neochlamydia sp. AcF95]
MAKCWRKCSERKWMSTLAIRSIHLKGLSSVMVSDPGSAVLVTDPLVTFSDPP